MRREFPIVLPLTREWIEITDGQPCKTVIPVLPLTREWIEIITVFDRHSSIIVLPLTREWIEITSVMIIDDIGACYPSYE